MSVGLFYMFILMLVALGLSGVLLNFFKSDENLPEYRFLRDPWLYLLILIGIGLTAITVVTPEWHDSLYPLGLMRVWLWLGLSTLIYVMFLFEVPTLLGFVVLLSSAIVTLTMPAESMIFQNVPFWADRLACGSLIVIFSFCMILLNGLAGILGIQFVGLGIGLAGVAFLGGIPLALGLMSAYLAGIWLGYLHFNFHPTKIQLHNGAALSAGFLFACLLLQGGIEMAGPSMLILGMYVWAEMLWFLFNRFALGERGTDLYENTGYWSIVNRGIEVPSVYFGISKIVLINVLLSWFQLYSPNGISLPACALAIDLWFLNVMFRITDEHKTFKEINGTFLQDLKNAFSDLVKSDRKDDK
jgi:UDP-N-acetylmuramyl pentapeptide phosphotransferase/UDP-N-acetylglucosamine-1-phosphate transferase